jgi:hypothetical protein
MDDDTRMAFAHLIEVLWQDCENDHGTFDSNWISAYADAIRFLSRLGYMDTEFCGSQCAATRYVEARLTDKGRELVRWAGMGNVCD